MRTGFERVYHELPRSFKESDLRILGRMRRTAASARWTLGATALTLCVSCTTLRVPSSIPRFEPSAWVSTEREGVVLRAVPLEGRDCYWELFDENLPELGIVALWVEIRNGGQAPVTLTDARWQLQTPAGKARSLSAAQVMERYRSGTSSRVYSASADADARDEVQSLLLAPGDLAGGQERAGFLFFAFNPEQDVRWSRTATLIAPPIQYPGGCAAIIELPLAYAIP